jgi:hypothetical protein
MRLKPPFTSPLCVLFMLLQLTPTFAAERGRPHTVSYGKTLTVKLFLGPDEDHTAPIKVRSLYVDGKLKEFVTGEAHEITDRLFAVRRAFRMNNNLPEDESKAINWVWERGGWLLVDRFTGRVSQLALVDFDPFYSQASWFRDYVAYCGVSDDGQKLSTMVMQLGHKKPLLRKDLGAASQGDTPDSECDAPRWEKKPTRVTFLPKHSEKQSFTIFGHAADTAVSDEE